MNSVSVAVKKAKSEREFISLAPGNVVYLSGFVYSHEARAKAEQLAWRALGVVFVVNRIEIK